MQENASLIKEINDLRRELHAARRAHTTPKKSPLPAKPAAKPAAKARSPARAATPPITAALMVSSARQPPISSAVKALSHEDANNAVLKEEDGEEGRAMELQGGDSVQSSDFGILAVGTGSDSQSGDLDIQLDCFDDGASRSGSGEPAAADTAERGEAAAELSSLRLSVSFRPFALLTTHRVPYFGEADM